MEVCPYSNKAIYPIKVPFSSLCWKDCITGCGLTGICFSDHIFNINYQPQRGYDGPSIIALNGMFHV